MRGLDWKFPSLISDYPLTPITYLYQWLPLLTLVLLFNILPATYPNWEIGCHARCMEQPQEATPFSFNLNEHIVSSSCSSILLLLNMYPGGL